MLYLFGPKETDFINGDSDLIHHTYDEVVDRSKGFYLKFKVTLDKDESYKKIKKEMIINAYTPDGWNQFRVFDIYNHSNYVEVVATQLHYDLNYKKVFPFVVNKTTAQTALNVFVANFKSDLPNFKFTSNITDVHSFSTDDDLERLDEGHNALEILNRIASRWGGELKVDGYNVHLTHKLGEFTNALLYEHKNISEFVDETSMSEIVTRIHAVSRFRPEREEGSSEEPEEVTIKVVVDSPLIGEYAQVYEEDYTNNDARTRDQLISWARLKYSTDNIDKPARSIKVETNIIDGQEINYGDDLVLKYTKHDVDEIIRCVGYQYNPNSRQYISVTLGSNSKSLSSTITGSVHDSTKNQLSNIEKQVQIIKYASNNRNRVTTGPLAIPDPIEGDMWYYHPDGRPNNVELRIFQDGGWVTIISDMTGENVRRAIADLELEADALAEDIVASEQKAASALEEAGLSKSAVDAFGIITQETANKMVDVEQIVDTAKTNAADALAEASQAKTDATDALAKARESATNSSGALALSGQAATDAQTAIDTAEAAKTDAQTAISNAATAQSDARTAIDNAKTALSTAGSADDKAGQAIAKANAIPTTITGIIADKNLVNGSYVDTKVDAATGAWSQELVRVEGKIPTYIGGRNLFIRSTSEYVYINDNGYIASSVFGIRTSDHIALDGEYVTTVYPTDTEDYYLVYVFYDIDGTFISRIRIDGISAKEHRLKQEDMPSNAVTMRVWARWIQHGKIKVEKGSVPTDWTPAPEDLYSQEEFKLFNAQYTQDVEGMTGRLTSVENNKLDGTTFQTFKQSEYQVTADKVASTVERVDTAEGKITTQGTAISQNATAIASKADKTVVDTLSGTVTTQGTAISQNATDIASKASTKTVNDLTGRVDTAESSISQNATAITQRVTTTTYNTGLATKENSVLKQSTAPTHLNGRLWLDTSVAPNILKRSTGTAWVKATPTTASEVGAYSSGQGNALAGRVTTAETNISQTSEAITSKADKSVVDTLSGTVSTHTTTLSQHATAISSKAEQSEVDTVKGTVSTHTSTLTQQAKDISARLTQSQVNSLVDGKGYSTVSYVDTEISATAGAIRTEMTAVEGKIDGLEIGGRNLLRNSDFENGVDFWQQHGGNTRHLDEDGYSGNGLRIVSTEKGTVIPRQPYTGNFYSGDSLTLSVKVKTHSGDFSNMRGRFAAIKDIPFSYKKHLKDGWELYVFTTEFQQDYSFSGTVFGFYSELGEFTIDEVKLEKGNIATDWTPAPEDMFSENDFNTFKAEYEQSAQGWSAKLLQIEQADYATKTWSNQTFATPQSVTTQLQSYAKTTDLNGLVTETSLTNKSYITSSAVNTLLTSYAKTTDLNGMVTETSLANKNYITASEVSTQLSSYAKTSALNGMVTETTLANKNYATASSVTTQLQSYAKTTDLNGLATESYVGTQISTTAGAIRTEMTAIEGKIPTEIGGANLFENIYSHHSNAGYDPNKWTSAIFKAEPNTTYTISIDDKQSNRFSVFYDTLANGMYAGYVNMEIIVDYFTTEIGDNISRTVTTPDYEGYIIIYLSVDDNSATDNIKIEKGSIKTDYTPPISELFLQNDFNTFKSSYDQSAQGWNAKLLQIEQAGYATKTWSNQTFATPQSVSTQLQSYAKTTALNGMVTETTLAAKNFITASAVNTLLTSYAKTSALNGMVTETTLANKNYATASSVTTQLQSYAKTTDLNGLATETYVGSQLSATAGSIRSEITAVEGKIPTAIGGRNLFIRSTSEYVHITSTGGIGGAINGIITSDHIELEGEYVTTVYPTDTSDYMLVYSFYDTNKTFISRIRIDGISAKEHRLTQASIPSNAVTMRVWARWIQDGKIKVEKGNVATDWSPAPEDMATSQQVSSIQQTADAVQTLVGTTKESVARAVMTSNLWETEVSKVIDNELEQQYKYVDSPKPYHTATTSRSVSQGTNEIITYLPLGSDGVINGSRIEVDIEYETAEGSKGNPVMSIQLGDAKGVDVVVYHSMKRAKFHLFVPQATVHGDVLKLNTSIADAGVNRWGYINRITVSTVERIEVPIDGTNTGAISSKITQLYDMINLSVLGKEGALSRISMGEEGIQIDGKLLHITARTFIDDAVIKSAMISSLDAGKITTGELNANNVKVINLDANSISGNEASFISAMFTNRNSALQITGNGITVSKSNGNRTFEVDSNGAHFYSDTGKGAYITTHNIVRWNGSSWVDTGSNSTLFASELNHSIGIGYKIWSGGQYVTRDAIRLDRSGSGTPELQVNLPIKNVDYQRGAVSGENGTYFRNTQDTAGIWMGDNGKLCLITYGKLYNSTAWLN